MSFKMSKKLSVKLTAIGANEKAEKKCEPKSPKSPKSDRFGWFLSRNKTPLTSQIPLFRRSNSAPKNKSKDRNNEGDEVSNGKGEKSGEKCSSSSSRRDGRQIHPKVDPSLALSSRSNLNNVDNKNYLNEQNHIQQQQQQLETELFPQVRVQTHRHFQVISQIKEKAKQLQGKPKAVVNKDNKASHVSLREQVEEDEGAEGDDYEDEDEDGDEEDTLIVGSSSWNGNVTATGSRDYSGNTIVANQSASGRLGSSPNNSLDIRPFARTSEKTTDEIYGNASEPSLGGDQREEYYWNGAFLQRNDFSPSSPSSHPNNLSSNGQDRHPTPAPPTCESFGLSSGPRSYRLQTYHQLNDGVDFENNDREDINRETESPALRLASLQEYHYRDKSCDTKPATFPLLTPKAERTQSQVSLPFPGGGAPGSPPGSRAALALHPPPPPPPASLPSNAYYYCSPPSYSNTLYNDNQYPGRPHVGYKSSPPPPPPPPPSSIHGSSGKTNNFDGNFDRMGSRDMREMHHQMSYYSHCYGNYGRERERDTDRDEGNDGQVTESEGGSRGFIDKGNMIPNRDNNNCNHSALPIAFYNKNYHLSPERHDQVWDQPVNGFQGHYRREFGSCPGPGFGPGTGCGPDGGSDYGCGFTCGGESSAPFDCYPNLEEPLNHLQPNREGNSIEDIVNYVDGYSADISLPQTQIITQTRNGPNFASQRGFISNTCLQQELTTSSNSIKDQQEVLSKELDEERMLRTQAEERLREAHFESHNCKSRLVALEEELRKMEEMVKNLVQFKSHIDHLKHQKSSLTIAYENKLRKYQSCVAALGKENMVLLNEIKNLESSGKEVSSQSSQSQSQEERERSLSRILLERLTLLEQQNSSLLLESDNQRLHYEKCLDDVANQVVQALVAQKNLREECIQLHRRVEELEQQNQLLNYVFKQQLLNPLSASLTMSGSAISDKTTELPTWPSLTGEIADEDHFQYNSLSRLCSGPVTTPNVYYNSKGEKEAPRFTERSPLPTIPSGSSAFSRYSQPKNPPSLMTRSLSAKSNLHVNTPHESVSQKPASAAFASTPVYFHQTQNNEGRLRSSQSVDENRMGYGSVGGEGGGGSRWLDLEESSISSLKGPSDYSPVRPNNVIRNNGGSAGISYLALSTSNRPNVLPVASFSRPTSERKGSKPKGSLERSSIYEEIIDRHQLSSEVSAYRVTPTLAVAAAVAVAVSSSSSQPSDAGNRSEDADVATVLRRTNSSNASPNCSATVTTSSHVISHNSASSPRPSSPSSSSLIKPVTGILFKSDSTLKLTSQLKSVTSSNGFAEKESPISVAAESSEPNGELVNKDEGYSTMSSDVQSDVPLLPNLDHNAVRLTSSTASASASVSATGVPSSASSASSINSAPKTSEGTPSHQSRQRFEKMTVLDEVENESGKSREGKERPDDYSLLKFNVQENNRKQSRAIRESLGLGKYKRNSYDPAFLKMMALLVPRGYENNKKHQRRTFPPLASPRDQPFLILDSNSVDDQAVETAEKATSADFSDKDMMYSALLDSPSKSLLTDMSQIASPQRVRLRCQSCVAQDNDCEQLQCHTLCRHLYLHITSANRFLPGLHRSSSDSQLYDRFNLLEGHAEDRIKGQEMDIDMEEAARGIRLTRSRKRGLRRTRPLRLSSSISTSSSAISDELESCLPPYYRRTNSKGLLLGENSTDDQSGDEYESFEHKRFVHHWLQNESGLRWDDSEVTWKLNEPFFVPSKRSPALDNWDVPWDGLGERNQFKRNMAASRLHDLEQINEASLSGTLTGNARSDDPKPLQLQTSCHQLTDVSNQPQLSVQAKDNVATNENGQEESSGEPTDIEAANFNRDFYRLCLVGSNKSLATPLSEDGSVGGKPMPLSTFSSEIKIDATSPSLSRKKVISTKSEDNALSTDCKQNCPQTPRLRRHPGNDSPNRSPSKIPSTSSSSFSSRKSSVQMKPPSLVNNERQSTSLTSNETVTPMVIEEHVISSKKAEKDKDRSVRKEGSDERKNKVIVKSSSSTSAKSLGAPGTRIPQPKHSTSLDQIKRKDEKIRSSHSHSHSQSGSKLSSSSSDHRARRHGKDVDRVIGTRGEAPESEKALGDQASSSRRSSGSHREGSSSRTSSASSKLRHSQSKIPKERAVKTARPKAVHSELALSEPPAIVEQSMSIPSAEELERRLSEEREVSVKIKELNALFKDEEEAPKKVPPPIPPRSFQKSPEKVRKLHHKKSKSRKSKEGHETSWGYMSSFGDQFTDIRSKGRDRYSSDSSSSDEEARDGVKTPMYHKQLHALHRFRRQRKRASDRDLVISYIPRIRATLVDRHDFYYRFGEKEQEAVACFDFLEGLQGSSSTSEGAANCSDEAPNGRREAEELLLESYLLASQAVCDEREEATKESEMVSSVDHISLSDSCAESYDGSDHEGNTNLIPYLL